MKGNREEKELHPSINLSEVACLLKQEAVISIKCITYVSSRSSTKASAVELKKAAITAMTKCKQKSDKVHVLFQCQPQPSCFPSFLTEAASPAKLAVAPANCASV